MTACINPKWKVGPQLTSTEISTEECSTKLKKITVYTKLNINII
jgi:hypothetical protein